MGWVKCSRKSTTGDWLIVVIYALPILLKISPLLKTWYLAKKTHHAPIALSDRLHGRLAFIGRAFIVLEQHLKCLKKTNAQELTAANKQVRMATSGQVLEPHGKLHIFADEKLFTVSVTINSQKDRFYITSIQIP